MSANETKHFAIVPKPPSPVEKADLGAKHILSMVADTLALAKKEQFKATQARTRIGDCEWCEPDYRQILLWAEETGRSIEFVVQRLIYNKSSFLNGRLIEVHWDDVSTLIRKMHFVAGLKIRVLALMNGARGHGILESLTRPSPGVTPMDYEVSEIDLEGLSELEQLIIPSQNLKELNLRYTPKLNNLRCESNMLSRIDFLGCRSLEKINARNNQLSELDLTNLPALKSLECNQNRLSYLDLSGVPALELLDCSENQWGVGEYDLFPIEVLDITPLKNLKSLKYDDEKTRLIQRLDQHF